MQIVVFFLSSQHQQYWLQNEYYNYTVISVEITCISKIHTIFWRQFKKIIIRLSQLPFKSVLSSNAISIHILLIEAQMRTKEEIQIEKTKQLIRIKSVICFFVFRKPHTTCMLYMAYKIKNCIKNKNQTVPNFFGNANLFTI